MRGAGSGPGVGNHHTIRSVGQKRDLGVRWVGRRPTTRSLGWGGLVGVFVCCGGDFAAPWAISLSPRKSAFLDGSGPGRREPACGHRCHLRRYCAELPRDLARRPIDGEQVIDPAQPTVALQTLQSGVGHLRAQRAPALVIARIGDRDRSEATRSSR